MTPFIVAEVSKSWIDGKPVDTTFNSLADAFEYLIETNRKRGYRLHSFQVHRLMTRPDELNETLVAVFEHTIHRADDVRRVAAH